MWCTPPEADRGFASGSISIIVGWRHYHLPDVLDDARIDAGAAAYRGFLFSDIRGFTSFAERYGNPAAAAKVSRFLDIARTAIARHEGAEVKTEGDAIHAVFPSASGAVLCGLEIVEAAAQLSALEPDGWFDLGVGVHAGEAVETAEGYIGRAVNIAARLCAVARPGEVLVSSTVKGITQASIQVGFIPKGKRRLKGIHDPILVYAVTRDMTASGRRELPRALFLGAAGLAIFAIAIAIVGSQLLGNPGSSPAAPAAPSTQPVVIGPLPIGKYTSQQFQPPVTFDIVDPGWTANREGPEVIGLLRDTAPRGSLYVLRVHEVIEDPCVQGGEGADTGLGAADVLADLESRGHLAVGDRRPAEVGGFMGQQVDVTVSEGVFAACGGMPGGEAAIFRAGAEIWNASPGERFELISVVVDDEPVTIVMSTDWTQTPSVQELVNLLDYGQRVINSVEFSSP
jgi:class 3 adenylate cyclase